MSKVSFTNFKGIRNDVSDHQIKPEEFEAAVNCDVNDAMRLKRRHGVAMYSAGAADSLYSNGAIALCRRNQILYQINADASLTQLQTGMANPITYEADGDRIFFSDGVVSGVFEGGAVIPWGITPPSSYPSFTETGGQLPRGGYKFAVTFATAEEESGTGVSIEASDIGGGISFSDLPVSSQSNVISKHIYLTRLNGNQLYRALTLPNATTEAIYSGNTSDLTVPLETQFKQNPTACSHMAVHNGRMLISVGSFLLFSDAYRYELFDPARNSYELDGAINMIAPVQGGVFIATEKSIFYLAGDDISQASLDRKASYGAVPGTLAYTEADNLGGDQSGSMVGLFTSHKGVCLIGDNGQFNNMTIKRYVFPVAINGASYMRLANGNARYISALRHN